MTTTPEYLCVVCHQRKGADIHDKTLSVTDTGEAQHPWVPGPLAPRQWIVTGTSMVVEAETEQDAIERAEQSSGWSWEATEYTREDI